MNSLIPTECSDQFTTHSNMFYWPEFSKYVALLRGLKKWAKACSEGCIMNCHQIYWTVTTITEMLTKITEMLLKIMKCSLKLWNATTMIIWKLQQKCQNPHENAKYDMVFVDSCEVTPKKKSPIDTKMWRNAKKNCQNVKKRQKISPESGETPRKIFGDSSLSGNYFCRFFTFRQFFLAFLHILAISKSPNKIARKWNEIAKIRWIAKIK